MGVLPQIQAMTPQTAIYNTAITQVQQKTFPKQRGTNYQKKKSRNKSNSLPSQTGKTYSNQTGVNTTPSST